MYTRNYRISKEDPLPQIAEPQEETELAPPPCEENEVKRPQRRYKATRIPHLIEPVICETEICEPPPPPKCEEHCPPKAPQPKKGLLTDLSLDETFILALAVLLLCQGGDDILVLALCFVLL